jgi:hypothetical protein
VAEWRKATQSKTLTKKPTASELFETAGLHRVRIFPIPNFASSSENPEKLKNLSLLPVQMLELYKDEVISKGFMKEDEYKEGIQELHNWLERQDTFWMVLSLLTIGTV